MMAQPTSFTVLVAALLINTLSYCSADSVYCVTPTATSCSSCPHNNHCATLSEYAQETELYFTSNTTMVFLPGDHTLDRSVTVVNVARLTMWASNNMATIVRNGSVGFSFTNMVDFNIYFLAFTSYNRSWSYGSHPASNSALFFQSIQNAELVNCSFHYNIGTALAVNNASVTLVENKFMHNQCACRSFSEMHELGCGITTFNSNLTFSGNTSFHNSTQTAFHSYAYCAGAIWASASSLHFTGTNNFIDNSANGINSVGAIYAQANTLLSFNGTSNFTHNSAKVGGAVVTADNVTVTFNGTNNFTSNSASHSGGAILAVSNTLLNFIGTNEFTHNSAEQNGGAIFAITNTSLTFIGTNNFTHNSAGIEGGAVVTANNSVLTFNGTNNFINNSANNGGAIYAVTHTSLTFIGTSNFTHNSAGIEGGAVVTADNVIVTFNGTNNFTSNSASDSGGAIFAVSNTLLNFIGTNEFSCNSAEQEGGAVVTANNSVLTFNGTNYFINNTANSGGAIFAVTDTSLIFIGTSNFTHNSAGIKGGAVLIADNGVLTFNGTNNFINNSANNGGAIFAVFHASSCFTGTSSFSNNSAIQGGAISGNSNITLTFNGNISFVNNGHNIRDSHGGAMHLAIDSTFFVLPHTIMCWENNYANLGGVIYVLTAIPFIQCNMTQIATFIPREKCFFQLPGQNLSSGLDVQLVFKNNSADAAGSVLYGGAIDNCGLDADYSGKVFDKLVHYEADNTASSISSDPFRICLCKLNDHPNCSQSLKTLSAYPGETFQVSVVTVGQRDGIVPAAVRSHTDKGRLASSQYIQQTTKMCTTLNYTVFSQEDVSLELYPEGPCSTFSAKLFLKLSVSQSCPPGFSLENSSLSCVCDQVLQKYTNNCNITNGQGQIARESDDTFWVGYDQYHRLSVHPYCPFDNCVSHAVNFSLNNTDMQCAYNKSGLLCGACKNEYSLVLGTSHCKQCTNSHLYLLIPFALMGIALVFLLLVCKLTVATGTLSGLVFYANIVGVNRTIFLPVESLSVFIAWLNLDFGIKTCFYNGMDAYSKTWLQFVFPVYIWVLVGLMILVSHFSQRFAYLLGNNPVSVLATLILLSYAKILRTLITTVYFTHLEYPTYNRSVWFYDANIDYIVGEHIPLFLAAVLVFFFLFLPYTLLLLFGQWLQAISHLRLFSWVNSARLKPFMDAYHAPYKAKHRYWPGLLLVLRFVLLLVFALNPQQDPNINLLAILVGAGILQLWAWVSGGVYKNWCLDALEGSFTLNLTILSATTYYIKHSGGNQLAVGYASVIIALATFIGILAYHIFQQLRHTKLWKKVPKLNLELKKKLNTKQAVNNLDNPINNPTESVNLDQLREPWLEDLLQPTHSSF